MTGSGVLAMSDRNKWQTGPLPPEGGQDPFIARKTSTDLPMFLQALKIQPAHNATLDVFDCVCKHYYLLRSARVKFPHVSFDTESL